MAREQVIFEQAALREPDFHHGHRDTEAERIGPHLRAFSLHDILLEAYEIESAIRGRPGMSRNALRQTGFGACVAGVLLQAQVPRIHPG